MSLGSPWRHFPVAVAVGVVLILLLVTVGLVAARALPPARTSAPAATALSGPCAAPDAGAPPFSHVDGGELIDTGGQVMVPDGVALYGLTRPDWRAELPQQESLIRGAITQWCANVVQLQIDPSLLLDRAPYDRGFFKAIEAEVAYAQSWDRNVLLTAEAGPGPGPSPQTAEFWKVVAPAFAHDPRVWFDLYDGPRAGGPEGWTAWRTGGRAGGTRFLGMQQLVDVVRQQGAPNLVYVAAPDSSGSLAGLPQHQVAGPGVAYAVHVPSGGTPQQWDTAFGNAAGAVPLLIDQWSESAVLNCAPHARVWVPKLLSYLRAKDVGLSVRGFQRGVLLTNATTFAPTTLTADHPCGSTGPGGPAENTAGAGSLVERYFRTSAKGGH